MLFIIYKEVRHYKKKNAYVFDSGFNGDLNKLRKRRFKEMKRFKGKFLALVVLVLLGIGFMPAQATHASSYAIATASFDWSGLLITGVSSGNISWVSRTTDIKATADNSSVLPVTNTGSASDWTTLLNPTASVLEGSAIGKATPTLLSATSTAGPPSYFSPSASATSERTGEFQYTGLTTATITVKIPYTLTYDLMASSTDPSYANGLSSVKLVFTKFSGGGATKEEVSWNDVLNGGLADTTENGLFTAQIGNFKTNDTGILSFKAFSTASASSPVPIPAPIMLLGAGLVGLAGLRKRMKV